jgi:hypothetical protein
MKGADLLAVLNNKGERGSALVMVLIFTAALLILGGALSTFMVNENFMAGNQEKDSRLYYITEAGIEAGVTAVSRYFNWSAGDIRGDIDGGSYRVEILWGPGIPSDHRYYEQLQGLQINPMDERVVISTGLLNDQEMAMAVIVKMHPLARKALMVSEKLEIENSIIDGNLHANEMVMVKGANLVIGELTYTYFDKSHGWTGVEPSITVRQKVNPADPDCEEYFEITYSASNNFTEDMQAPEIKVPPINFNNFLRKVNYAYLTDQTWRVTGDCRDDDVILVKGDLTINPRTNQTIELANKIIIVEKNLVIEAKKDAAANLINCVFVTYGTIQVSGSVNRGIADRDSNMVLLVSNGDIDVTKVLFDDGTGEDSMFFGGRLLLFSKSNVHIGAANLKSRFDMYGTIIADRVSLNMCRLNYVPDIFDEYGNMLGLGVVMKEWIKPWRPQ